MDHTQAGLNMGLAVKHVVVEPETEHDNAITLHPNMVVENAVVLPVK